VRVGKPLVLALCAIMAAGMLFAGGCSRGEKFPSKPIEVIVGWGAGGGTDIFTRNVVPAAEEILGVSIAVVNMPGAASATAMDYVMKQPADGYTVFAITSDILPNAVLGRTPYTPQDLRPLIRAHVDIGLIQVGKKSPFNTWEELVAYAKQNPGKVTIGGTGAGSYDEVAVAVVTRSAGLDVEYVPFDSASEMHAALMGGHIMAMYEETGPAIGMIESGDVWPVLVFAEERLERFPDVPCVKELGLDLPPLQWRGLAVKKGTPEEVCKILEDAFAKACESQQYKEFASKRFLDLYPGFLRGADFAKSLEDELKQYEEILKQLGYKK